MFERQGGAAAHTHDDALDDTVRHVACDRRAHRDDARSDDADDDTDTDGGESDAAH
jgi:hypothetical protein